MNPKLSNHRAFWFMLFVGLLTVGITSYLKPMHQTQTLPADDKCSDKEIAALKDAEDLGKSANVNDRIKAVQALSFFSDCRNTVETTTALATDLYSNLSSTEERLEVAFAVLHSLENARIGDVALGSNEQALALSVAKNYLDKILQDKVSEKDEVIKRFCSVVGLLVTELEAAGQNEEAQRWNKVRTKYQQFGKLIPQAEKIKKKIRRYQFNLAQLGELLEHR